MFSASKKPKNNHILYRKERKASDWRTEIVTAIKEQPQGQETRKEELKENLSVAENAAQSVSSTLGSPDDEVHSRGSQKHVECKAKVSITLTTIVCNYGEVLVHNIPFIKMYGSNAVVLAVG